MAADGPKSLSLNGYLFLSPLFSNMSLKIFGREKKRRKNTKIIR